MVQQVTFLRTNIRIVQGLVNLHWLCLDILAILVVQTFLGNLADVYLGIEVGGKCLVVVTSIAVHYIQVLNLFEMMLGSVCCKDTGNSRVKTTSQDGAQTCLFETFAISPLPTVLEVSLILGFIVGGIHIVTARLQTGLHNGKVLIRKCQIDYKFRFVGTQQ